MYKENKNTELKAQYTTNVLKTVSAFANFHDGRIIIGIHDDGTTIEPITNIIQEKLNIENAINSEIKPIPNYEIRIIKEKEGDILEINVYKGEDGPYYYKHHAYMRQDTSTIQVDAPNLNRLILKFKNMSYDQVDVENLDLNFAFLERELKNIQGISKLSKDVLITNQLFQNGKYNNAALLLSDNGNAIQSYIDIAKLSLDSNTFYDRLILSNQSILKHLDDAYNYFLQNYPPYDTIEGLKRVTKYSVPQESFREALTNAIIHRDYSYTNGIQISFFDNRIEITSPGGLVDGIDENNFIDGPSIPRNPIIANLFLRLKKIERFGTGIKRIIESYEKENSKPSFIIKKNQITVVLPVLNYSYSLLEANKAIIAYLQAFPNSPRAEIEEALKIEKHTLIRRLNELISKGKIESKGNGKSLTYNVK
ncbi:MAG TPA: AAA family ATPase [Acholeplasma sp.]|nr:AAA family ATPase [Acholeplasma sp.]